MDAKLYNRQGITLSSNTGIVQPKKENTQNKMLGRVFSEIARETGRLSRENYALGRAQLINDVLTTAYEQAPDNPKQFNDLVQSGFEKGLEGLDENTKQKIYNAANDKVKNLQIRVGNNLNKKLDAENSQRVAGMAEDALYGLNGIADLNQQIADSIINGDPREKIDSLIKSKNKRIAQYRSLASAKNMRGGLILGKGALRELSKTNESVMYETIQDNILNMDINELKKFDSESFQDRKGFLEKTGLSQSSYAKLTNVIKRQGKLFDENYKREVKSQNEIEVAKMLSYYNEETMQELKGSIPKEMYTKLEEMKKNSEGVSYNPALMTNEDDVFLNEFAEIFDVITAKDDGSTNFKENKILSAIDAKNAITKLRKKGISEDIAQVIDNTLTQGLTDSVFSETLSNNITKDSALYKTIMGNKGLQYALGARDLDYQRVGYASSGYDRQIQEAIARGDLVETDVKGSHVKARITSKDNIQGLLTDRIMKDSRNVATNGINDILRVASQAQNYPDDVKKEIYQKEVVPIIDKLNKDIIKTKISPIINRPTMDNAEKELKEKGFALIPLGTKVVKFLGWTSDDIILEDMY